MTNNPEHDPLADLLTTPGPVDTEALRQSLLAETTRRLTRPRQLRIVAIAAALAACYVAGLFTMYLLRPEAPPVNVVRDDHHPEPAPGPVVETLPFPTEEPQPSQQIASAERAALLRQEGDRQLTEDNDPQAALQSYTKALNVGPDDDAKFSPDDNWLLMAIKNAREKEARHANNGG